MIEDDAFYRGMMKVFIISILYNKQYLGESEFGYEGEPIYRYVHKINKKYSNKYIILKEHDKIQILDECLNLCDKKCVWYVITSRGDNSIDKFADISAGAAFAYRRMIL